MFPIENISKKNTEENFNDLDNDTNNDNDNNNNYKEDLFLNKEKFELNKCKMKISYYAVRLRSNLI